MAACCFLLAGSCLMAQEPVFHKLLVRLDPANHRIEVTDHITLPANLLGQSIEIELHRDLALAVKSDGYRLADADPANSNAAEISRRYRLEPGESASPQLEVHYHGKIHHPLQQDPRESTRSFAGTPGLISSEGVYLAGSSYWVPTIGDQLVTFTLEVSLPPGWDAVSQGRRSRHHPTSDGTQVLWESPEAMDEPFLIAGQFSEYSRQAGNVTAYAFLQNPDPNLAQRYLEVTAQYIDMYRRLIGQYPYDKFALVENFWETGYGMPSFTLLGPQVIRLPFILHSSYPHEILHNWWGNSVFVDYRGGNWCEGLTAYLADHLVKEGQGQGGEYRRDTLKRYLNFVRDEQDFALRDFQSRHLPSTEAVGYGKSLMLWHMLRQRLGEDRFRRALQSIYRRNRGKRASFDDLSKGFSEVAGEDLSPFFDQWVDRVGAPELQLGDVSVQPDQDRFKTRVEIRQVQPGDPYQLDVPLAFTLDGADVADVRVAPVDASDTLFEVSLAQRPLAVRLDPDFDLFRRLDRSEIPPSLGQIFGAARLTIVLPGSDEAVPAEEWQKLAEAWAKDPQQKTTILTQEQLATIPADSAVWILGSSNRWAKSLQQSLSRHRAGLSRSTVAFGEGETPRAGHSFVFTATHPMDPDLAIGWIGSEVTAAVPGLIRKLPHYGKYSYLAFAGDEPTNNVKGQWPIRDSVLVRQFTAADDAVPTATLPVREPLARLEPVFDPESLMGHIRHLSTPQMEGRGVGTRGLDEAAEYIAQAFGKAGLKPGGDRGTYFQTWSEADGPDGSSVTLKNVIGVLPGERSDWASQSVVIAAHYDHLGRGWPDVRHNERGKIHPGADDNASGVAVLLELAALLSKQLKPPRNIVFAAFSGEEWGLKGSRHYVASNRPFATESTLAMINLDSVGHLGAGKILVLGSGSATEWVHINRGIGFTTGIESESVSDDFGSSDQKAFLDAGVPAVQIFSGPSTHYHRSSDTAETIDAAGLVKIATFVREALVYLSERDRPLTSTLKPTAETSPTPAATGSRRVSLGTLPDFAFAGPGVRIQAVSEGTPAALAGLLAGDVITHIDDAVIENLRAYADILRAHQPGDRLRIQVQRGAETVVVEAELVAR